MNGKPRQIVFPGDLAPWDQIPFFRLPVENFFPNANTGDQIAGADPNRTHLIICGPVGASIIVSTKKNPGTPQGLPVVAGTGIVSLSTHDNGPLVNVAWFLSTGGPVNITVFEVLANTWPNGNNMSVDDRLEAMKNATVSRPANGNGSNNGYNPVWPEYATKKPTDIISNCRQLVSKLRSSGIGY